MSHLNNAKVNIYIKEGKTDIFIASVKRGKAIFLSQAIRRQLEEGSRPDTIDRDGAFFASEEVDRTSARTIAKYINSVDTYGDPSKKAISIKHVGCKDLEKMLRVHAACHHFGISKTKRGEVLREDTLKVIRNSPPTLKTFALVFEATGFDGGLCSAALHSFVQAKLGDNPPKEAEQVEDYIRAIGLEKKMLNVAFFIKGKKEEAKNDSKKVEDKAAGPAPVVVPVPIWVKPRQVRALFHLTVACMTVPRPQCETAS